MKLLFLELSLLMHLSLGLFMYDKASGTRKIMNVRNYLKGREDLV